MTHPFSSPASRPFADRLAASLQLLKSSAGLLWKNKIWMLFSVLAMLPLLILFFLLLGWISQAMPHMTSLQTLSPDAASLEIQKALIQALSDHLSVYHVINLASDVAWVVCGGLLAKACWLSLQQRNLRSWWRDSATYPQRIVLIMLGVNTGVVVLLLNSLSQQAGGLFALLLLFFLLLFYCWVGLCIAVWAGEVKAAGLWRTAARALVLFTRVWLEQISLALLLLGGGMAVLTGGGLALSVLVALLVALGKMLGIATSLLLMLALLLGAAFTLAMLILATTLSIIATMLLYVYAQTGRTTPPFLQTEPAAPSLPPGG